MWEWANTPSANTCLFNQCRPLVAIDNGSNAASVHDIYMENVTFTHSNNAPVALVNHYPLPYNITVEGSRFEHLGAEGFYSAGWWKNLFIRNDHFSDWGTGITAGHADGIVTFDYTGYGGTSQYTMDLSGTTFDPTTQPPDGYGFAAEIGAGGAGWTSDLTMENNHFNDGGTGNGGSVSGEFKTATISGNDWTNGGPCELLGNNITVTGNTIKNGTILRYPWIDLADTGGVISGNTIEMVGPMYSTCGHSSYINQTAISVGGLGTVEHPVLTQAIRQTAQSFTVSSISCTTQTVANVPPTEILNGTFSGGASNGYLNWAFTISGAINNGNNGVLVAAASTGSTLTFVNPMCVTETTSAATAVSSATTTDYVGSFGGSNNVGSLNGLVGQDRVYVRDFVNAGNNTNTTVTGTSFAYTTIGGSGAYVIQASNTYGAGQQFVLHAPFPDKLYLLDGQTFTVSATDLSSSQFAFIQAIGGGSGTTGATFNVIPMTILANDLTALAVTNPSGVSETHAGNMALTPSSYNANVGTNEINMGTSTGDCGGIMLGFGNDGQGAVYNANVHGNTVVSQPGFASGCAGIFVQTGTVAPESSGFDFKGNVFTNLGIGIRLDAPAASFQDVTAEGNKFTGVGTPIYVPVIPVGYRQWDNVTSATQTTEILNGGVTIDASGNTTIPTTLTVAGGSNLNGGGQAKSPSSGQPGWYVLASDNLAANPNQEWTAPFPYTVATPTGTPSSSGGTITASPTNVAYISCVTALPPTYPDSPAVNVSNPVITTGSTSSIAWTWAAQAGCGGSPTYHIWVAQSGTPAYYFTSATNSYTQTAPASSGTSGTFPSAIDYVAARESDDGSISLHEPYRLRAGSSERPKLPPDRHGWERHQDRIGLWERRRRRHRQQRNSMESCLLCSDRNSRKRDDAFHWLGVLAGERSTCGSHSSKRCRSYRLDRYKFRSFSSRRRTGYSSGWHYDTNDYRFERCFVKWGSCSPVADITL